MPKSRIAFLVALCALLLAAPVGGQENGRLSKSGVYWLGPYFAGLRLTETRYQSFAYGECKPPEGEGGCQLPVRVGNATSCTRNPIGSVNEAASVALSGRAKLKVRRARGATQTKLVPVFAPQTVRFAAPAEGKVTLSLSRRGRKALRSLSQVKLLIAGEARDDAGGRATSTATGTLR